MVQRYHIAHVIPSYFFMRASVVTLTKIKVSELCKIITRLF